MPNDYQHLNMDERSLIQVSLREGSTLREIAHSMHRAPSTISRELARNGWTVPVKRQGRGRPVRVGPYQAVQAQKRATRLAHVPRIEPRLVPGTWLWAQVLKLLRGRHSPQQISGILRKMYPDQPDRHVSHETIYTALYALPRGELRAALVRQLRQARKRRRRHVKGEEKRGKIPQMVSIHERPPEIEERLIPGHWEGDLIKGAHGRSSVGTLVERSTLFVSLVKMPDATAQSAVRGFSRILKRIDVQRRLSLTYDQGTEMSQHQKLAKLTGVKIYFADPRSPWQRALNENTNGLLRQYLPRAEDLSRFTQAQLDAIAFELNVRPRKSLDWKCPLELFMPESFDYAAYFHSTVAVPT
jgi:IS30 family transposase